MSNELQESYEALPYESYPFPQSHPDRLATVGWLFGLAPTPLERCRILEIGCAAGGNIIPIAETLPNAELVGIDFSQVQINAGLADLKALGFTNIRLHALDIMDFGEEFGAFDYIIAHGVYSWVPDEVQERLFEICKRRLAPSGIAYISYNTLPGWHVRSFARDAMRYQTRTLTDPKTSVAQARAVLNFLAESVDENASPYGKLLRNEAEYLSKQGDYYIFHDHLEAVNDPVYFYEFVERVAKHGLGYLGEANFASMIGSDFSAKTNQTLERIAPDVIRREQFMDFLRARTFRETLLVHDDVKVQRKLSPLRVMGLRIASRARPVDGKVDLRSNVADDFSTPEGRSLKATSRLTKAALLALADRWPLAVPFDEVCADAYAHLGLPGPVGDDARQHLASEFLVLYSTSILELRYAPSPFVLEVGDRPEASKVARLQAGRTFKVTSLRHEHGSFNEDTRKLFLMLDGTRTRREIATALWKTLPEADAMRELDKALNHLARLALFAR